MINIDHVGPLRIHDKADKKWILVIIDSFSRFVELYVVDSTDAYDTAKSLLSYFGRYGIPACIRSDKGSAFVNHVIEELTQITGTYHEIGLPGSHEENAIVEREIQEVLRHLRAILLDGGIGEVFEEVLWMVQRILNAAHHRSLGTSPGVVVFGSYVDLDRRILHPEDRPTDSKNKPYPLSDYINKRMVAQENTLKLAVKHQKDIDVANMHKRTPAEITIFPLTTYVLAKHPDSRMGNMPDSKLKAYWQGPFRVIGIDGPVYTVQDLITLEEKQFHVKMLKAFEYDKDYTDPQDVVDKEAQLYVIEKVLNHHCINRPNYITDYEFLVHWQNKPEREDSWISWKDAKENEAVHEYMKNFPELKKKIPK